MPSGIAEAEAKGTERWSAKPDSGDRLELSGPWGSSVTWSGTVTVRNPQVDGTPLPFDVVVSVQIEDEPRPRAVVRSLTLEARADGLPITGDRVRKAPLGTLLERAIGHLTMRSGAKVPIARVARLASSSGGEPRSDRRSAERMERLREFARLHDEAVSKGKPYAAYVAQRMTAIAADRITENRARQMKREAIAAGIELAGQN